MLAKGRQIDVFHSEAGGAAALCLAHRSEMDPWATGMGRSAFHRRPKEEARVLGVPQFPFGKNCKSQRNRFLQFPNRNLKGQFQWKQAIELGEISRRKPPKVRSFNGKSWDP